MAISRDEVLHIARLARIELGESEIASFERELSAILDFASKLAGVPTETVEPLTGGTDLANVMREDEEGDGVSGASAKELIDAAPEKRNGFVEVKAVFDRK